MVGNPSLPSGNMPPTGPSLHMALQTTEEF